METHGYLWGDDLASSLWSLLQKQLGHVNKWKNVMAKAQMMAYNGGDGNHEVVVVSSYDKEGWLGMCNFSLNFFLFLILGVSVF